MEKGDKFYENNPFSWEMQQRIEDAKWVIPYQNNFFTNNFLNYNFFFYRKKKKKTHQWFRTTIIHLVRESVNCLHGSFSVGGAHLYNCGWPEIKPCWPCLDSCISGNQMAVSWPRMTSAGTKEKTSLLHVIYTSAV